MSEPNANGALAAAKESPLSAASECACGAGQGTAQLPVAASAAGSDTVSEKPSKGSINKYDLPLKTLAIEFRDKLGTFRVDLNRSAIMGSKRALPLSGPIGPSVLSGKPGYGYRSYEVSLVLTDDEILRLLRKDLRPHEVEKLMDKYGSFFEIHDDFYDFETYEALQPMDDYYD